MSNSNSGDMASDKQQLDEKWPDKQWTDAHSKLFVSVFPPIHEQEYKQSHLQGFYNPNIYTYDRLHIRALQDHPDYSLSINDQDFQIDKLIDSQTISGLQAFFKHPADRLPLLVETCPYCRVPLRLAEHRESDDDYENTFTCGLEYCSNCQYWRWHHLESRLVGRYSVDVYEYTSFLSKLRDFSDKLPEGCASELAQWVRRNPKRWHTIAPYRLEKLVADIFKATYKHAEVTHIGKPDDGGVDVLFVEASEKQWLIQVKRREKPKHAEAVGTIRNLLGAMLLEGSSWGIVVSTADHFTYRAYQAVNRAKERGMYVKLVDRGGLNQMLGSVLPDRPWLVALRTAYPAFADRFAEIIPSTNYHQHRLL